MDFKVGDEVRIKADADSSTYAKNNRGLVSKIRNIGTGMAASVINLESSGSHGVWDYELELVVPANVSYGKTQNRLMNHQWKVGDQAIARCNNHTAFKNGDIIEIMAIDVYYNFIVKRLSDSLWSTISPQFLEPISVNAAVNTKVALPPGYTVSNSVWNNFYPSDAWVSEYEDKPAKPAIACECGQRTAAKNAQEDDPQFHATFCPVYKSKEKK